MNRGIIRMIHLYRRGIVFGFLALALGIVPVWAGEPDHTAQGPAGFPGKGIFPRTGTAPIASDLPPKMPPVQWAQEGGGASRNPVFQMTAEAGSEGEWKHRFHVSSLPSGSVKPGTEDFYSGVVESGGILWLGSAQGDLLAVGAEHGNLLWSRYLGGPLLSPPVTSARTLYVVSARPGVTIPHMVLYAQTRRLIRGDGNERLWALSIKKGESRWSARLRGGVMGTPVLLGHSVMVATGRGHLVFLDRQDGHQVYDLPVDSRSFGWASPVEKDHQVVLAQENPPLYQAVSLDGLQRLWRFQWKGTRTWDHFFIGTPLLSDGLLIGVVRVRSPIEDVIVALDFRTGTLKWKFAFPAGNADGIEDHSLPTLSDGLVYVPSGPAHLLAALDVQTGKEQWVLHLPEAPETGGSAVGQLLLLPLPSGMLLSIDRATGVVVARKKVAEALGPHPPVVVGGHCFLASRNGLVRSMLITGLGRTAGDLAARTWPVPVVDQTRNSSSTGEVSRMPPS
ncbi:MAG: outer membrane protein assembly factor BamB family protein [Leptospirales bacterium]